MAKLNYDRDVKTLVNKLQDSYKNSTGYKLQVREAADKWVVNSINNSASAELCRGTLRECYCFLLGIQEIINK